jgi:hypothetical protein
MGLIICEGERPGTKWTARQWRRWKIAHYIYLGCVAAVGVLFIIALTLTLIEVYG